MELIKNRPLTTLWLKASVVGSLWASFEIVFGSFLHNLKVPFSGTILAFISVYMLISFFQVWKVNGIIWRAGVICALMKSISPSAVILGPMVGILSEAFLLEVFIRIMGKNLFAYIVGGALAIFSALLHKFFSLLILFGFDLVKILAALYQYSVKQLNIENADPNVLIAFISIIYLAAGMVAAIAGWKTGKKFLQAEVLQQLNSEVNLKSKKGLFDFTTKQKYSLFLLAIHITAIVLVLLLMNFGQTLFAIVSAISYITFCFVRYPSPLRRLKKISTWVQFVLITLVATIFWESVSKGVYFSMEGLIIGLKMIFRAIVIIIGFAAISIELRNPLVKSVLYNKGLASLYQSLTLSFSALPDLVSNLPRSKELIKNPALLTTRLLQQSQSLLHAFEKGNSQKPTVVIVTGDIRHGKTTFTQGIIDRLEQKGVLIGGFLAQGIENKSERVGFNLVNIEDGNELELCRIKGGKNWKKTGKYFFNPEIIEQGNGWISPVKMSGKSLIIIDEVGSMELNNDGWSNAMEKLLDETHIPQFWVVRKKLVKKVARKWDVGDVYIVDIEKDSEEDVFYLLSKIIAEKSPR